MTHVVSHVVYKLHLKLNSSASHPIHTVCETKHCSLNTRGSLRTSAHLDALARAQVVKKSRNSVAHRPKKGKCRYLKTLESSGNMRLLSTQWKGSQKELPLRPLHLKASQALSWASIENASPLAGRSVHTQKCVA